MATERMHKLVGAYPCRSRCRPGAMLDHHPRRGTYELVELDFVNELHRRTQRQ